MPMEIDSIRRKSQNMSIDLFRGLIYTDKKEDTNSASSSNYSESSSASTSSASIENTDENIIIICHESGGTCKIDP
jgi:hypothetical protein